MSDELSDRMHAAAGPGPTPPLDAAWSEGRRRRNRRRLLAATGGVVGVLLLVAVAVSALGSDDGSLQVASGPTTTTTSLANATCDPEPGMEDGPTPATARAFVERGSGQSVGPSDVVARVKVLRSWWLDPEPVGPDEQYWQHRVEVEVTDPVLGAEVGDRLEVFDAMALGGKDQPEGITGPTCHLFEEGDDLIVALAAPSPSSDEPYELNGSSAFFLITDGRFSAELDAARRSLADRQPAYGDSELLRQARDLTPDELLDVLRDVAGTGGSKESDGSTEPEGDVAVWNVDPDALPVAGSSSFTALVTRVECASGRTGEVLQPTIDFSGDEITITFSLAPLPDAGAVATCQGNPQVPFEVDLGEPLGDRKLVDGACAATLGGKTSYCLPTATRWPT